MPGFEALVRRALAAKERSTSLTVDSQRLRAFAQLLRDAWTGDVLLLRCAWCSRFRVGDEWLNLTAIGEQEQQIASGLLEKASHGICPDCFAKMMHRANARKD